MGLAAGAPWWMKNRLFYSGNVWDYEPMCRKCHGIYDRKRDPICVIEGMRKEALQ